MSTEYPQEDGLTNPVTYTIGLGIGRPLDPEWANTFEQAFKAIVHPSVSLLMRQVPGIVYAKGWEFYHLDPGQQLDADTDVQADVDSLIEELSAEDELERHVALSGLATRMTGLSTVTRQSGLKALRAEVLDVSNGSYFGQLIINNERRILEQALAVKNPRPRSSDGSPTHKVQLGMIDDPKQKVTRQVARTITRSIDRRLRLGKISPLHH